MELYIEVHSENDLTTWVIAADQRLIEKYRDQFLNTHENMKHLERPIFLFPITQKPTVGEIAKDIFLIDLSEKASDNMKSAVSAVFSVNNKFFEDCCIDVKTPILCLSELNLLNNGDNIKRWYSEKGLQCIAIYDQID